MTLVRPLALTAVLACALAAPPTHAQQPQPHPPAAPAQKPDAAALSIGIDLAGMDRSVAPGDDFFLFANGAWVKETEIPADKASYGAGSIVFDLTTQRTEELIRNAASSQAPKGSEAQKVGDYYASYLDAAGIEAKGLQPLQATLDAIAAIGAATATRWS